LHQILNNQVATWTNNQTPIGKHQLILRLVNKLPEDTQLDKSGKIIDDLSATITNFYIDGIDFTNKLNQLSTYYNNEDQLVNTWGHLSFNKDYIINFQTPGVYLKRNASILTDIDLKNYLTT
jgi:hypothetical protein